MRDELEIKLKLIEKKERISQYLKSTGKTQEDVVITTQLAVLVSEMAMIEWILEIESTEKKEEKILHLYRKDGESSYELNLRKIKRMLQNVDIHDKENEIIKGICDAAFINLWPEPYRHRLYVMIKETFER